MSDNCKVDDCQQRELNAEIERLQPYVAAFQREEERADKLGQEVDELRDQLVIAGEHIAEMMDQLASARKVVDAARAYYLCAVQDEAAELECCATENQHELAKALRDALTDEQGK